MKHTAAITALLAVLLLVVNGSEINTNKDKKEEVKQDVFKILVLIPVASKSHVIAFIPLLQALAQKGHQLTFISMIHMTTSIPAIEEIVLTEISDIFEEMFPNPLITKILSSATISNMTIMLQKLCSIMFHDHRVADVMKRKYDLVIVDSLMGECVFPIIHKLQVPFISLCTTSLYAWTAWSMNVPTPFSYVPQQMTSYSAAMTFKERVINSFMHLTYLVLREMFAVRTIEEFITEHYPDFPGVSDFEKNTSLVLTNSHPSLDVIRPTMPFVIEVGGMHCKPGEPLPKNLDDFVKGAGEAGFIFFSLGSNVKGTDMPYYLQRMFIDAFSRLKQRVIWKFEAEMSDLPPNILITKWAPQQDLLAHPSIKLFITHAGQLSTQEAVYHAVPVIGIPIYADQMGNIANLQHRGIGEPIDHQSLTEDIIYDTIRKIIDNKSYKENAAKLSKVFKDRPQKSVETALYWVEYVVRYQGAHHLKAPLRHLNFFQYFLIDVVAFVFLVIVIIFVIGFCILRFLFRKIRGCASGKKSKSD